MTNVPVLTPVLYFRDKRAIHQRRAGKTSKNLYAPEAILKEDWSKNQVSAMRQHYPVTVHCLILSFKRQITSQF